MKRPIQQFVFVVFLLFSWASSGVCQQIIFNKVPPPDGNSFNFVTGITQDLYGNMWFGEKIGLFCYDGSRMITYKSNPGNPKSISSNNMEPILADEKGNIWVGLLGAGLDYFDHESGEFIHYRHDPKKPESLGNDTVISILNVLIRKQILFLITAIMQMISQV